MHIVQKNLRPDVKGQTLHMTVGSQQRELLGRGEAFLGSAKKCLLRFVQAGGNCATKVCNNVTYLFI